MLYSVVTYANMRGVRAVDRIVDLCQRDLAFIWLTKGQKPQRDVFTILKEKKLTGEVLDELNYQFMRRLRRKALSHSKSFPLTEQSLKRTQTDTRSSGVEASTITFAGLLDAIDALYAKYNAFLSENGYGTKYDLGDAHMFVIEGMDKVRKVIEENRKRKLTKHKRFQ